MMQVIAQRGTSSFLVASGYRGVVVDLSTGTIGRSLPVQSILARGYWAEVKDSAGSQKALALAEAQ